MGVWRGAGAARHTRLSTGLFSKSAIRNLSVLAGYAQSRRHQNAADSPNFFRKALSRRRDPVERRRTSLT